MTQCQKWFQGVFKLIEGLLKTRFFLLGSSTHNEVLYWVTIWWHMLYCNIVYALHIRPIVLCKINCLPTCGYSHMVVYTYDDATHCVGIVSFAINFVVSYCTQFLPRNGFLEVLWSLYPVHCSYTSYGSVYSCIELMWELAVLKVLIVTRDPLLFVVSL